MPKKIVTWVVVADGGRASIFVNDGPGRGLNPSDAPTFKSDTPHSTHEMVSDREGRSWSGTGAGRHAMDAPTDPKRHSEFTFVREVARFVGEAARDRKFDRLVLVASPKALGDFRAQLPKHAQERITSEVPKDLVRLDAKALEKHLVDAGALV